MFGKVGCIVLNSGSHKVSMKEPLMTLPNRLILARIGLALLTYLSIYYGFQMLSLLFYCLGLISDCVDGLLARRTGKESTFGRSMDSVADKILATALMIGLLRTGSMPYHLVFFFILREFLITGVRAIKTKSGSTIGQINDKLGRLRFLVLHTGLILLVLSSTALPLYMPGVVLVFLSILFSYIVLGWYLVKDSKELFASMKSVT
jgi:CDP-diacylglycerol--glycerol-3-phosphate 3-phosphatidyltransferase